MGRLRCYCFDLNCRENPPRIEPDNKGAASIAIGRSVGQGGANVRDDVLTIQQALNGVSPGQGGPALRLATDGLVGPLTTAAIGKFQRQNIGFADFRVDPGGPTIQALNRVLGASPAILAPRGGVGQAAPPPAPTFTVTDEMMQKAFTDIVPISQSCVKTALRTLAAAKVPDTIQTPPQALVRKHFALQITDPLPPDFALVERTFRAIDHEFSVASLAGEATFTKFPFTLSYREMASNHTLALSLMHGVAGRGQTVKLDRTDGTSATLPVDAVVLAPHFFLAGQDLQIGTLIHELAHFVGRSENSDDGIDDPESGSSSDADIAQLTPEQRPRIAECYAMFAFEAHFGRPMFKHLLNF